MPKKIKTMTQREVADRNQEIAARITEIAELAAAEHRDLTQAEDEECQALRREQRQLEARMGEILADRLNSAIGQQPNRRDLDREFREAFAVAGQRTEIVLLREGETETPPASPILKTTDVANTGIIGISERQMLDPLRQESIWGFLGMPIESGLAGEIRWPIHGTIGASWEGEGEELVDKAIDFNALKMSGKSLGVTTSASNELLDDSHGVVERVITQELPQGCLEAINKRVFATVSSDTAPNGPFVGSLADTNRKVTFAGATPTRDEVLAMVAKVTASHVKMLKPCFVVDEVTKAQLMGVKIDAGSGRFLLEDGKMLGYPVYCDENMSGGKIGFGDFSYLPAGFFGRSRLTVDPYTLAKKNSVQFTQWMRFGMATLRKEAFVIGVPTLS